jgi:hypothetical protein
MMPLYSGTLMSFTHVQSPVLRIARSKQLGLSLADLSLNRTTFWFSWDNTSLFPAASNR